MPELPEVETLRRQLAAVALGSRVVRTAIFDSKLEGVSFTPGNRLRSIDRHGKWLRLYFEDGSEYRFHLRMTGRLFLCREAPIPAHARMLLQLAQGNRSIFLFLIDPRRFATVQVVRPGQVPPGEDASRPLSAKVLFDSASRRKVSVKSFLLDQKTLAGIGNIYACEILHAAKINPCRRANQVSRPEWRRIIACMPKILNEAIACRGSSISDWRDLHGQKGEFQNRLKVYGREGATCGVCGGKISRIKQEGRSTFYCPRCQK